MIYRITYRIINTIKVTAIISGDLISEIKKYTKGKNITESLTIALKEWLALKKIRMLNSLVSEEPLEFNENFTVENIRRLSRS